MNEDKHPSPGIPDKINIQAQYEVKLTLETALELYLSQDGAVKFPDCLANAMGMLDLTIHAVTKKRNIERR